MKKSASEKPNVKETEETIGYPRLDLERVLPILKKIVDSGGIVTRSQLAEICKVNERGGGFNHIVSALKLYSVVNKEGQSDFKINDLGRGLAKGDKNSFMQALMRIPIFKDLYNRYSGNIPKKSVAMGYLIDRYTLEKATANTVASRFIKNIRFLNSLQGDIKIYDEPTKGQQQPQIEFYTYKTIVDLYSDLKIGKLQKFNDALDILKGIKLPSISGNEIISNLVNIQGETEEDKKTVLKMILELIIKSYSK
jgi:hypothetical protein